MKKTKKIFQLFIFILNSIRIFSKSFAILIISIVFILLLFNQGYAQTELLERKIKLTDYKGTAKDVLDRISKDERIVFAYSSEILLNYDVSFSKKQLMLKEFLEFLFKGKPIGYKINGDKVMLYATKEFPDHVERTTKNVVQGVVKDSQTKEPLGYCNVAIKGTNKGAITNIEGAFSITVDVTKDVLLFSYLGYEAQTVEASVLLKKHDIYLKKKEVILKEVVIHSNDDYLYDIMDKCRKKLKENKAERTAKVYFGLETRLKLLGGEYLIDSNWIDLNFDTNQLNEEKPVELLECLYNADIEGDKVKELGFKNGRMALASNDNYFMNMGTSTAISELSLTKDNQMYPIIPFQFNKRAMDRNFIVESGFFDGKVYQIKFYPKNKNKSAFCGEAWIDGNNFNLIKIHLKAENTEVHPFLPNFPRDTIKDVTLDISNTYKTESELSFPDNFVVEYKINYLSRKDTSFLEKKRLNSVIKSKSIMYFYDYDKPFILPYFDYTENLFGRDDSYRISFVPYNETLWNSENIVLQTEKQKKEYGILSNSGQLKNYRQGNYSSGYLSNLPGHYLGTGHFAFYYPYWDSLKRVIPSRTGENFNTYSKEKINSSIRNDLYKLNVQIMLDIVETRDSLVCKSYTVFDNEKSFYHLPTNYYTNAFLNIYFDFCEIERRKMQQKLDGGNYNLAQINEIYNQAIENLNSISDKFFKEVNVGENEKMLKKWNDYVFEKLNIDNMKMVENSEKKAEE